MEQTSSPVTVILTLNEVKGKNLGTRTRPFATLRVTTKLDTTAHYHSESERKVNLIGTKGFTLLEVIIILAITGLLAGGLVTVGHQVIKKGQEDKTIEHLKRLRVAVMGDPLDVRHGVRTSFGYFGDMGVLPSILDNLYKKGTQTPYSLNQSLNTGAGWNGPYISPETIEYLNNLKKDYFGKDLQYTSPASFTKYVDSTVGVTVEEKITSSGREHLTGTGDDLSAVFFNNELYSRVSGFIRDADGNSIQGVTLAINYPSNGSLTTTTATTDANGLYSFNNVPYGNHSLSITTPRLFLASGTGNTTANGAIVTFSIINASTSSITLTSLRADYSIKPPTYYGAVYVGGTSVKTNNPRVGTGTTVTFTATAAGTTYTPGAVAVCVQSPVTEVPDTYLSRLGVGAVTEISLVDFYDSPSGGNSINMTGVVFTITFSDGSVVILTP